MEERAPGGLIARLVGDCCVELTGSLRTEGEPASNGVAAEAGSPEVTSFLEVSGAGFRATLTTTPSVDFLRATHPRSFRGVTLAELTSWSSEIVNQLAGRLVNKLGRRGVALQIGTPGSVMGREMRLWFPQEEAPVFDTPGLKAFLSTDEMHTDLVIPYEEQTDFSQEGDLLLF